MVALNTFSDLVHQAREQIEADGLAAGSSPDPTPLRNGGTGAKAYAEAVSVYLGFAVDRLADRLSSITSWDLSREGVSHTFTRQAIPILWDYAEANPFSSSSGNWIGMNNWVCKAVTNSIPFAKGIEVQHDAQILTYPEEIVISTDLPYYDNIVCADLSDFFFCWMRRTMKTVFPDLFNVLATPKAEELVAIPARHGGPENAQDFFLDGMQQVMNNIVRQCSEEIPATIYYAFKQSEIAQEGISSTGWATFLQAVIEAGYEVVGTWPMRTELSNRMNGLGSNALANSVVLVCRKRQDSADTITRAEFIR